MARSIRTDIENNGKVDHLSRPIFRTNPKLSTNVKLVVTDEEMYLDSIDASNLLLNSKYKKYLIKDTGSYAYDISKFWRLNSTPLDLAFKTKRNYSDFSVLDSYDKQYEDSYSYGTVGNYSKLYDYEYRMFAPIWLDKNIPSKFLIYRIKDPINSTNYSNDNNLDRINEMLAKSTLIKTVDLSSSSKIGKYLRNYISDENFPSSPLTVSFDKDSQTFYNGIDLQKGGFVNKGEYQYKDTVDLDKPLIEYNKFISEGFERNSMVCANLINLEFMFDDDQTEEFSINRYFGIYVDEHEIGSGLVSDINNDLVTFSEISHTLDLNGSDDFYAIPDSDLYKKSPMLGWVKSFSGYHNVKNGATWSTKKNQLKIDSNNKDLSAFLGIKKTDNLIDLTENKEGVEDFLRVEIINNPISGDSFGIHSLKKQRFVVSILDNVNDSNSIFIYDNTGQYIESAIGTTEKETLENIQTAWYTASTFDRYNVELEQINNKYQLSLVEKEYNFDESHNFYSLDSVSGSSPVQGVSISDTIVKVERTFTPMDVVKNTFTCDNSLDKGKFTGNSFSGNGSIKNIITAISNMLDNKTRFSTIASDETLLIKSPIKGYNRKREVFLEKNGNSSFLQINSNEDINNSLNLGTLVLSTHTSYFLKGGSNKDESVYVKTDDLGQIQIGEYLINIDNSFNKVLDIVEDSRDITSDYGLLILENKNKSNIGINNVYRDFKLGWGMFSAYDIYDFNFDFYDTSNSDLKELELEDDNAYPNDNVVGVVSDPNTEIQGDSPYDDRDSLFKESVDYFSNLTPILNDESVEEESLEKIYSEFDRLQENYTTQFATTSRIIPTINKWCLKDSKNVRENKYYLNVDESFGETNFSPNLEVEERDKDKMTHEWFYLDNIPDYVNTSNSSEVFSYVNLAGDLKFSLEKLKDVNFDYFKTYFLGSGFMSGSPVYFNKTESFKRYTLLEGGSSQSFASTIFKGLKFTPKLRKKIENKITKEFIKNSEFNGYRFSTCLKTRFNESTPNFLKVNVIENKRFKTITLVLELNLSDGAYDYLNRKLLYELDHKTKNNSYADSLISGALDLSSVNLFQGGFTTIYGIEAANGSIPQFTTQILKDPNTGQYGPISITIGTLTYSLQVNSVINDSELKVSGAMLTDTGVPQPTTYYSNNDYMAAGYGYQNGGIFAHKTLLEQLSPSGISNILNNTNNAEYITVNEDGSTINNRFYLQIEDGLEIIKTSKLYPEVDINKPKSFKLSNEVIGYDIQERAEYFSFLTRQNGNYTVDMRPIVTFTEPYSMHKIDTDWTSESYSNSVYNYDISKVNLNNLTAALYKKLNGCGVLFNVGEVKDVRHDMKWGLIKNHFFHKVNEIDTEGVIKLTEVDDLLPKYQLINEIAIDKKDKNVFKSRWENNYYTRSLDGGNTTLLPGTKNIVEEKSYIASSVIKTNESYDLFSFTSQQFENIEQLNEIRLANVTTSQINFIDTKTEIIADFYINKNLISFLDNKGIRKTLKKYVTAENSFGRVDTLDDDIEGYISENIIKKYSISSIDLYVLESKEISTNFESVASLSIIDTGGYIINNNYSFKLDPTNPLNFRLIYNKKIGFSYEIRPLVKIKA